MRIPEPTDCCHFHVCRFVGDPVCPCECAHFFELAGEMMKTALQAPSAHSLVECMRELKFGRPGQQQLVIDEAINFIIARLGNDGPPFNPDIVGEIFKSG